MLLLYICAGTGVAMILMTIIIMIALMRFKDPSNTQLILCYDDLMTIIWVMLLAGCILLGMSTMAEVSMLGRI